MNYPAASSGVSPKKHRTPQGAGNITLARFKLRPGIANGYLYLGEFYSDTGQNEKAIESLTRAEAEFREMGMGYWLNRTQEILGRI